MQDNYGDEMEEESGGPRNLTDADVAALTAAMADAMEKRLVARFYFNLGKGLWKLIWAAILLGFLWLAAFGATGGKH